MSSAVVVQHVAHEGSGWLAELLEDAGVRVDVRRMYDGAPVPALDECDALIVMGGPMSAHDDGQVPWLRGVMRLLVDATAAGTPTLGICLGAQLLALAGGGVIEKGASGPELGVCPLTLTSDAGRDELFRGVDPQPQAVQWHWDHIARLPDGAVLLAS